MEGTDADGRTDFSLSFAAIEDKFGNKHFFFAIPLDPGWTNSLERITLTGPEGTVTVDADDPRTLTFVTDRDTGEIRGILRDWDAPLPASLGSGGNLSTRTTRGIGEILR